VATIFKVLADEGRDTVILGEDRLTVRTWKPNATLCITANNRNILVVVFFIMVNLKHCLQAV
jgi:hypothetical protein